MRRLIASTLAAAVILAAPGPAAHAVVAKAVVSANAVSGVGQVGAGGAAVGLNGKAGLDLTQIGTSFSLKSTLPTASFKGLNVLKTAEGGISAVKSVGIVAHDSVETSVSPSASVSVVAPKQDAAKKTAMGRLSAAVSGIPHLLGLKGSSLKAASGQTFDNAGRHSGTAVAASADSIGHARSGLKAAGKSNVAADVPGVEDVAGRAETPAPKQKVWRAIRIGALTAIIMLAADTIIMGVATHFGYVFHPSYEMPALTDPAAFAALGDTAAMILSKVQEVFMGAFVAPFNEEVYFRAGVMGLAALGATRTLNGAVKLLTKIKPSLAKLRAWITPAAFGIAATEAALFFAFLHEMSDPILITIRIIQALLMSYLYVREGLVSGMVHHGVFNGLAILTLPFIYATVGGTTTILTGPALLIGALLAAAAYLIWKFTRKTARAEARELRAGTLAPYRLSARSSTWLGRVGWGAVALLAGLAMIQPAAAGMVMLGSMAAQMAPAALALTAYGFLMKNLERRQGAAAVDAIRNPQAWFPMGNRVGAWVGGAFGAIYLGVIAASFLLQGVMAALAGASLTTITVVAAAIPGAILAGILAYRWFARKRGISPWVYLAQYFFATMAAMMAAMPWLAPMLMKVQETIAASGINGTMIMPAVASLAWMMPLFVILAAGMTWIARRIMRSGVPSKPAE